MNRLFMLLPTIFMLLGHVNGQVLPGRGELVITEIMTNPESVSDTKGEWIEIQNVTDRMILLTGVILKDLGSNRHVIGAEDPVTIGAGAYFVIAREGDITLNGGFNADYTTSGFTLGNTEDEVILCLEDGTVIDEIHYGNGWPLHSGSSMELHPDHLNPADNDSPVFWFLATRTYGDGDLGTPGVGPAAAGVKLVRETGWHLALYPNPCAGRFMLEVSFPRLAEGEIRLTNILGQTILQETFLATSILRRIFEPAFMEKGLYFLEVLTMEEQSVTRLIV